MGRHSSASRRSGGISRIAEAVKRVLARGGKSQPEVREETAAIANQATSGTAMPRPRRVESDIPLDVIQQTYTPHDTSSKQSFRSSGDDHERDQELVLGTADERWNREDHYANKSGDPRIGTHGRTYEPGEQNREESR